MHFEFPVAETIDIQKLYHKSANIESISPVLQPLVTEFSACSGCLLLVQRPCTVFSSQSTLKLFIMRECRPLQQLLMLHCLPPQKSLPCLGTKPDPTLVPVFRLRAAMVQPIPVPIPAPWVGVARTQPVPAPLQQSEGCKVSTSTPAGAKASQPRLLATTQATSRSLPPLSGCDVIVSGVLSPPS